MSPCTCDPGPHHPACLLRTLQPGQRVTATFSPLSRGTYQITGVLKDDPAGLLLGGWEMVRLANGDAPTYLRSVELAGDDTEDEPTPGHRSWQVDEPALLSGIPDHVYHGGLVRTPGPQVSQSGLKLLRPPSTPAEFQHYLLHGMTPTDAMAWGSAVHTCVLGEGDEYVRHPDEEEGYLSSTGSWNSTKKSKEWIAEQRAAGRIPLKGDRYDSIRQAQDSIMAHPVAAELFTDPAGRAEVSAYHEAVPGLWMRSRFDLLRGSLVDLKTAADPHPDAWRVQAWKLGYHVQDVSYRRAFMACTGQPDPGPMMFIVVGSKAPHLVSVVSLDAEFERLGNEQLDAALDLYAAQYAKHGDPRTAGVRWDGLPPETAVLAPPRHAFYDAEGVEYEPEF